MTDQMTPEATTTLPPPSTNGTPRSTNGAAPQASAQRQTSAQRPARTRTSSVRNALIVGAVALVVVLIFIFQNTSAVSVNFLGAQLNVSLAVAMLFSAVVGALIMAAAGTARITQLRMNLRRERRGSQGG